MTTIQSDDRADGSHRLLHVSDLHVGGADPSATAAPQARLAEVLVAAQSRGPFDVVVATGDICDSGAVRDAEAAREILDRMAPRLLATPGNHDRSTVMQNTFGAPLLSLGGWLIVGADTTVPGEVYGDGRPLAQAIARLDQQDPARPAIVIHHHPVRSRSTHDWFTLRHHKEVVDALARRSAPLLLLSGHTHEAFDEADGNVRFVGAPSTYYGLAHHGRTWEPRPDATGAVVIDLYQDASSIVDFLGA